MELCCSSSSTLMAATRLPPAKPSMLSSSNAVFFRNHLRDKTQKLDSCRVGVPPSSRRRSGGCRCLFGLGVPELVVIAGVAVLVFGPKKLPEIGRSIGKTVKSFQEHGFTKLPAAPVPDSNQTRIRWDLPPMRIGHATWRVRGVSCFKHGKDSTCRDMENGGDGDDEREEGDEEEEEVEEEEDEGEEEPRLKYQRMGGNMPSLLSNNAAASMAIAERMIALGTHNGTVHFLNFQGNQAAKEFETELKKEPEGSGSITSSDGKSIAVDNENEEKKLETSGTKENP